MFEISEIKDAEFYLALAFRRARKKAQAKKEPKEKELARINAVKDIIYDRFNKIINEFPRLNNLNDFYKALFIEIANYKEIKIALSNIAWCKGKINALANSYIKKINKEKNKLNISKIRKEFYGRVASLVKAQNKNLLTLENARKIIQEFPNIKEMPTLTIFGFPNVGKTTLFSMLTSSKPEIAAYPFTTKRINVGYTKLNGKNVQVLDVPGTLNRFEKMNNIEKLAWLALKHVTNIIVFVFDPFLPLTKQEKLLEKARSFNKEIINYISKTDIANKEKIIKIKFNYEAIDDLNLLKEKLKELLNLKLFS